MDPITDLSQIPLAVLIAAGVLLVVQVALQAIAIIQLLKTPQERVTIGGRKWVWGIIILLGEIIGPIVWFVAGRRPAPVDDVRAESNGESKQSAVDTLYGTEETLR